MAGRVVAVATRAGHSFSKTVVPEIRLQAGLGVEGDGHRGVTVQHRSRVAQNPLQPNLRQVHLVHTELFEELAASGHSVQPGDIGENVATAGVDLLNLPRGARLRVGEALVEVTGLRNPCKQLDAFKPGLMAATLDRRADGTLVRKAGVMAVVIEGGAVRAGDAITVTLPAETVALEPV